LQEGAGRGDDERRPFVGRDLRMLPGHQAGQDAQAGQAGRLAPGGAVVGQRGWFVEAVEVLLVGQPRFQRLQPAGGGVYFAGEQQDGAAPLAEQSGHHRRAGRGGEEEGRNGRFPRQRLAQFPKSGQFVKYLKDAG
jgi:hypothetical protein